MYTDYARLKSLKQTSTPQDVTLQPEGTASELNLDYPFSEELTGRGKIFVRYLSRGQLGFRHPTLETSLGRLGTSATAHVEDSTDGFGMVFIEKSSDLDLEEWLEACDDLAQRVLNILSLAQGRWLQWTAREVSAGDAFRSRRIRPRELHETALAHLFHHLNLQPILEVAVRSYTRELIQKTGLDIALSWMLAPTADIEGRFLNQIIALEGLVTAFEPKMRGLMPKAAFKSIVRPKLSEAIEELVESKQLEEEQGEIFAAKIKELNYPVFYDKIGQLIEYYKVPVCDLESELKFVLVDCRNDLVHRGLLHKIGDDSARLHRSSDIAEELLKRIVMAMLGYRGQYISVLYNLDAYVFKDDHVEPLNKRK